MKSSVARCLLVFLPFICMKNANADDKFLPFFGNTFDEMKDERSGQSFILSLWSIDCAPCRLELDLLGKLLRENPSAPIVIVSTDPIENRETAKFILEEYGLEAKLTWMFADGYVEKLRYSIDPTWFGELPRSYAFDSRHKGIAHSGILDREKLEEFLTIIEWQPNQ